MMESNNPGERGDFPILLLRNNDRIFDPYVIAEPIKYCPASELVFYKYIIGNIIYCFFVPNSNTEINLFILENTLDYNKTSIIELPEGMGEALFMEHLS